MNNPIKAALNLYKKNKSCILTTKTCLFLYGCASSYINKSISPAIIKIHISVKKKIFTPLLG